MTTTTVAVAPTESAPTRQTLAIGHGAVLRAIEQNTVRVVVPALGTLRLPPPETLAWLGGLATLAAVGLIEWPVAAALAAGHVLAQQHHVKMLQDFGEALEEA